MNYGITTITNLSGEVTIDGEKPILTTYLTSSVNSTSYNSRINKFSIPKPTGVSNLMLIVDWPVGMTLIAGETTSNHFVLFSETLNITLLDYKWVTTTSSAGASGSGYGLELYNSLGEVIFTTEEEHPRIKINTSTLGVVTEHYQRTLTTSGLTSNTYFLPLGAIYDLADFSEGGGGGFQAIWKRTALNTFEVVPAAQETDYYSLQLEAAHGLSGSFISFSF